MSYFERYREIVPDFAEFESALREPLPTHIRVNRLKVEADFLLERFERRGIRLEKTMPDETCYLAEGLDSPGNLLEYFMGYFHPQALTSCLVSRVLAPRPGSYVLDICSAPGGKTAHMAEIMGNCGLLIANELYPRRHIPLGYTLDRLGVTNAVMTGYQAQQFPLKQGFDYVLADVPCSGEGRFRKAKPADQYRVRAERHNLPELQRRIVLRAFDLLNSGGVMVYATCTYDPSENESVVDFLLRNRDAQLLPIVAGLHGDPGVVRWKGERYDDRMERTVRFYPHRIDSVGFFVARIGKPG